MHTSRQARPEKTIIGEIYRKNHNELIFNLRNQVAMKVTEQTVVAVTKRFSSNACHDVANL